MWCQLYVASQSYELSLQVILNVGLLHDVGCYGTQVCVAKRRAAIGRPPPPPTIPPPPAPDPSDNISQSLKMHVVMQIVVLMALLIRMLTWQSAMTGLGVTLGIIPLSIWVGRLQTRVRLNVVEKTDARVKLTGEVLSGEFHVVFLGFPPPPRPFPPVAGTRHCRSRSRHSLHFGDQVGGPLTEVKLQVMSAAHE